MRAPIVTLVMIAVAVMAVTLLALDPMQWGKAVLALVFLPLAALIMWGMRRKRVGADKPRRTSATVRAAMVGGGALLVSALGFEIAEYFGWISEDGEDSRSWISLVLVLVVVFGDLLAARLERADED